jgi:hypothetical protein
LQYFTVQSQADADLLASCSTFTGDLIISGSNASAPLTIPGPTHIKGTLKMILSRNIDPGVTSLTMSSLVSVSGEIRISQSGRLYKPLPVSNVTMISFPSLEHTSWHFRIDYLSVLKTLDLPRLSRAKYLDLFGLPALSNLSVPALTSVSELSLCMLPALHTLSFPGPLNSGFFSFGPHITIRNTSLSQISGLSFRSVTSIFIAFNKNLRVITFPILTLASTPYGRGPSTISVYGNGNGDDFVLNLPKLKHVKTEDQSRNTIGAAMHLYGVRTVNVQELQTVDGNLDIGATSGLVNSRFNYSTALTDFSAPKLSKVGGSLNIGNSSRLRFLSFPVLKTVVGDVRISGIPAVNLEKGIEMPRLKSMHGFQIVGTSPYCEDWNVRQSRGMVWGEWFWCGERAKWTTTEMEHKLWEDRKPIDDCYPYEGPWCVTKKRLHWGSVEMVVFVMAIMLIGVWWCRRKRVCK